MKTVAVPLTHELCWQTGTPQGGVYAELYDVLDELSRELRCGTCSVCENDLVYLLPGEVVRFREFGASLVDVDGVSFVAKQPGCDELCPFRDRSGGQCTIYDQRPVCCRMFPLDISSRGSELWWVARSYCPKVAYDRDLIGDHLVPYIPRIERCLNDDLLSFMAHVDGVTGNMEAYLGIQSGSRFIRPVGAPA
ncbi:MAG: YkgJ family cysteine cluster protein [Planctomycetota bacterium]|jgi:Fe-S-cluster containining protein